MRLRPSALLCAVFAILIAVPAAATETPPGDHEGTEEAEGRLMLVLDSSGSMKENASGGGTKIAAAKKALKQVVSELPDDAEVGMRVFGAKVFSAKDKGACTDTQNVVPVGALDRKALTKQIDSYKPYGETPIGNALKGAADDLGAEGKRTIVLLSDGEPTCRPDPCDVAKDLRKSGVDLKVNVVGLSVSGKARSALQCIADAGGGTYYDVNSPQELADSLVTVSVRAFRAFSVNGKPVIGGQTASQPLAVKDGQYTDAIGPGETSRYYVIDKKPGFSVHASATSRPKSSGLTVDGFTLKLSDPAGGDCGYQRVSRVNVLQERAIVSAGITYVPGVTKSVDDETCATAKKLILEVTFDRGDTDKPFELIIGHRPKVVNLAALPEPVTDLKPYLIGATATGTPRPVVGGSGFSDAASLKPGLYTDTLRPGEELIYRVPVGWGQALRVTATVEADAAADKVLGASGNSVDITAFNPIRSKIDLRDNTDRDVDAGGLYNASRALRMTAALPPVRLKNAGANDWYIDEVSLAGDYLFSVRMGKLDDDVNFAVPVTIAVEVAGKVSGVPEYSEPVGKAAKKPAASSGDDGGIPTAVWGGLGGVLVLAAIVGAFVLGRRGDSHTEG